MLSEKVVAVSHCLVSTLLGPFVTQAAKKCRYLMLLSTKKELYLQLLHCSQPSGSTPITPSFMLQVYKGRLNTGEEVAVKVQRPYVLETVTVDLHIIR